MTGAGDEAREGTLYEIRMQGSVDPAWSELLHGMNVSVMHVTGKPAVSRLTGRLADRTALASVLDLLFDRGFTLLSVRMLGEERVVERGKESQ